MRTKETGGFLLAAMRVMRETEYVLRFSGVAFTGAAPFDLHPHIAAMLSLCEENDLDDRPIDHLRHVARVIDGLRGSIEPADLRAAEESAAQYELWLARAFPDAVARLRKESSERASESRRKHALN